MNMAVMTIAPLIGIAAALLMILARFGHAHTYRWMGTIFAVLSLRYLRSCLLVLPLRYLRTMQPNPGAWR